MSEVAVQTAPADHVLETQLTALLSAQKTEEDIGALVPTLVKEFGGFAESTPADGTIIGFLFYAKVTVQANNINKRADGSTGGIGGAGVNKSWGTLYYNNIDDLKGKCAVRVNATGVHLNINFTFPGGQVASYIGGGVGTIAGIFTSSTDWEDI